MKESFYVQWVNDEGMKEIPVLANECRTFRDALDWAMAWDTPRWAKPKTELIIWRGMPGRSSSPSIRLEMGSLDDMRIALGMSGWPLRCPRCNGEMMLVGASVRACVDCGLERETI
ncbi:MAG: hypothetical protein KC415_21625 [Anaerolineales bacterium]|nr:hypothetical protein [Anaerolineales bacterium]MCB8991816.1 hypothetical protein [Ardenticatenaceae bacterium]